MKTFIALLLALSPAAFALETVPYVDLDRYLGKWYEIARYPNRFQKDCVATTAEYSLRKDGDIKVVNQCRKKTLDGKIDRATGKAWVTDKTTNAKLKVRFFWPFSGNYWIIGLTENYDFAIVGEPSLKYLWFLSRTPTIPEDVYQDAIELVKAQGYDPAKLVRTLQPTLD